MRVMEISKPVGVAIAAAVAVLLVGLAGWFAFGQSSGAAVPSSVGIPAVASPAMAPPDAALPGGAPPGQMMSTDANGAPVAPGAAMAPGQIPQ